MALSSIPWWDPKYSGAGSPKPPHERVIPLVNSMKLRQAQRYRNMRKMIAVYEYGYSASSSTNNDLNPIEDRNLSFNVAKNAVDTMHAQTMAPKIEPMLMTSGGSHEQQERAKRATQALKGVLSEQNFDEIQEDITLDADVAYLGFVKVFSEVSDRGDDDEDAHAELRLERLIPEDVFVDDSEGRYRKPRCIYVRQFVDRYVLLAQYGVADPGLYGNRKQRRDAIMKAKAGRPEVEDWMGQDVDQVEVWECWHLPSGCSDDDDLAEGDHDGLHFIGIEGCTFVSEPYGRTRLPIAVYRPAKSRYGFWGLAGMRDIMAGQREYERVTSKLGKAHKMLGGAHFVVNRGANINVRELTNGTGTVVETDGEAPKEWVPSPANPQTYQYREGIANDMLRFRGISTLAAQSEVPSGLSQASGVALGKFEDTESKRGILRHRARERTVCDVCELILDEARDLLSKGVRINTRFRDKSSFVQIDWNDIVDVLKDRANYIVEISPVGAAGDSPAGRIARLDSMLERQLITASQYREMSDDPDVIAMNAFEDADEKIIKRNLDYMVRTGKYLAPQPFDALEQIKVLGGKYYNAMRVSEVPDSKLELIRRYITDAAALLTPAKPAVEPGMPADPNAVMQAAQDSGAMPQDMPLGGPMPPDVGAPPMLPPGAMPPGAPPMM